jgi:hypothetical protein
MVRTFCTNVASTSATKQFDFGGTDLARCLPQISARKGSARCAHIKIGGGTWTRSREDQRRDALSLAGCSSRRGSPGKLCHKAPRSQGSLETPQKNYEMPWSRTYLRHRQATFLRCAMKVIGNVDKQETGCWFNNRAENSHQPFRRRERVTLRFRRRFRSIKY